MDYKYEMRIETKNKKKVIRYVGDDAHLNWSDTYNSAGAVIGDEPDQFEEKGILIGKISVPDMYWNEVVEIMIEDAGLMSGDAEKVFLEDEEISVVK
ncbi:MAG: hypothetical protein GY714_05470 [Desulfobacterales bacterium]|nr:hypothetical protein [Desulfobacterales bacterium]